MKPKQLLPASNHEFPFTGSATNLSVDVHCKESTGAVEYGRE